jgi:hypothetical protein
MKLSLKRRKVASVGALACLAAFGVLLLSSGAGATGNGAPSGSHYTVNIIGVPKGKSADMTGNNGSRIFVLLNGGEDATSLNGKPYNTLDKVNTIGLVPAPAGESFQVLDANATDSTGAVFQLPADVSTSWTVWARALGTREARQSRRPVPLRSSTPQPGRSTARRRARCTSATRGSRPSPTSRTSCCS